MNMVMEAANATQVMLEPDLNVSSALNENNSKAKKGICYVESFNYGGEDLEVKLPGFDPKEHSPKKVAALKETMNWLGCGNPYEFDLFVDFDGKAVIEQRNLKKAPIVVTMNFKLYKFDHATGEYYEAIFMDSPLEAVLMPGIRPHPVQDPDERIREADLFRVSFNVLFKKDGEDQELNYASNAGAKGVVKVSLARAS